jgi:4-hydroxy-tetrahydrodipicolinate reductase
MPITVCLAGATGWAGAELARSIAAAPDLQLASAVARRHAGARLGDVLDDPRLDAAIFGTAREALAVPCDVFVEYTGAEAAKGHIVAALERGAHVVVGSSGLTDADLAELDLLARERGRAVLACGNFALTVVLLQRFAEIAAKYVPTWEIVDYASDGKPDAPSGTARELAARLTRIRRPELTVAVSDTIGLREARGADVSGTRVHSLRLPGFVIGVEILFGMADQRLSLRHDAGSSAQPYVDGALLAIRKVGGLVGVHRGLDVVLDL